MVFLNQRSLSQKEKRINKRLPPSCPHASKDGPHQRACRKQHKPTTCLAHTISTRDFGSAIVRHELSVNSPLSQHEFSKLVFR
ncbi:hypothetical protein F2Q69_00013277 [Brassica cretica]|uniref:Uncharacterized protein n=1 Tax=Brassica cretica TaxID=69181 RepID=A0A8S9QX50_BRACR|nr:hypothetical protein F2Q69_00013277 [Brassica cretica]